MTPPCHSFPASELPIKVQQDTSGRRRKLPNGARRVDLSACTLLEMLQYKCEVVEPVTRDSLVRCFPVERLFRQCKDKKGSFLVETTAWEESKSSQSDAAADWTAKATQWSSSWHDADEAPR